MEWNRSTEGPVTGQKLIHYLLQHRFIDVWAQCLIFNKLHVSFFNYLAYKAGGHTL